MVKVNLDIETELHKAIRKEAIDKGVSMKAYLIELIKKGMGIQEGGSIEEGKIEE